MPRYPSIQYYVYGLYGDDYTKLNWTKGVKMYFRAAMTKLFTVAGLLVEPSTSIEKPKGYIESPPSIH